MLSKKSPEVPSVPKTLGWCGRVQVRKIKSPLAPQALSRSLPFELFRRRLRVGARPKLPRNQKCLPPPKLALPATRRVVPSPHPVTLRRNEGTWLQDWQLAGKAPLSTIGSGQRPFRGCGGLHAARLAPTPRVAEIVYENRGAFDK